MNRWTTMMTKVTKKLQVNIFQKYIEQYSKFIWTFCIFLGFSIHEFRIREQTIKTGQKSGTHRYLVTLCIPPYTFRRKNDATDIGNKAVFICTGCAKLGRQLSANGILVRIKFYLKKIKLYLSLFILNLQVNLDENGCPQYELSLEPHNHICAPYYIIKLCLRKKYISMYIYIKFFLSNEWIKKNYRFLLCLQQWYKKKNALYPFFHQMPPQYLLLHQHPYLISQSLLQLQFLKAQAFSQKR